MIVELSEQARHQVEAIDAWWRQNRLAAPDLFVREVAHAISLLEQSSQIGTSYEVEMRSVRRLLLERTHYHLYFVDQDGRVVIVAVWSAFRARGPVL